MKFNKHSIALLKGFVTPPNDGMDNRIAVSTVQAHLMQYGYMLDEDAFFAMAKADLSWIVTFNDEAIDFLKEALGGKKNFIPHYKNFPEDVMSLSNYELFWNLIKHYWSHGTWEPSKFEFEKPIKFEKIKYTILKYADEATFANIFTSLVSINTSLTAQDLEAVKWFVNSGEPLVFPAQIPFKENLMTLAAMGIPGLPIKTPTDVLRIAVHMSGGDISLPSVPRKMIKISRWSSHKSFNPERLKFQFKKFKRAERKYLLGLLEQTHCNPAEMVLKDQRWIRLGEILHPGEYKAQYPKAYEAFKKIREGNVTSWYGQVEKAFKTSFDVGLAKLSERPGEFARRLDSLIRKNPAHIEHIMLAWQSCIEGTSNKVLFEQYAHFENRLRQGAPRNIRIKGSRKVQQLPALPALKPEIVEVIHQNIFGGLKQKYAKLDPLGNCWIDEELKKIPLPTDMRSLNFALKPKVRGTRIPLANPDAKVVRPYLHFTKSKTSITIDLSVVFVGENTRGGTTCYYGNMRNGDYAYHSGDSFARTGDCAEYIDIVVDKALAAGMRYALIQIHNYNRAPELDNNNKFGIMTREFPEANRDWLPETISDAYDIVCKNIVNCAIIDLKTRELILVDEDADGKGWVNIASTLDFKQVENYVREPKVSVYDLILMHVEARGKQVNLDNNVDTYFKAEDFMHSYEKTGELMGV